MPEGLLFAGAAVASVTFWVLLCWLLGFRLPRKRWQNEQRHWESLRGQRRGQSLETFREHFAGRQLPPEIVDEVYKFLQATVAVENFPVLPGDNLGKIYGLDEEEAGYAMEDLLARLNRRWRRVKSVEDLVRRMSQESEEKPRASAICAPERLPDRRAVSSTSPVGPAR